tara:strand:- start:286 stop:399 length:114 start_codon:yes stop_codon:yes gene_type:complete
MQQLEVLVIEMDKESIESVAIGAQSTQSKTGWSNKTK